MCLFNKILIGLIMVASLVFFYFGARVLKTHQVWRNSIRAHEQALATVVTEKQKLTEGTPGDEGSMGIKQLQTELDKLMLRRGRVWYHTKHSTAKETGEVMVITEAPAPKDVVQHQVFAFEEGEETRPGQYLGSFTVTNFAEANKQWQLRANKMIPSEIDRLQKSRGLWVLYEVMPHEDPEAMADEGTQKPAAADTATDDLVKDKDLVDMIVPATRKPTEVEEQAAGKTVKILRKLVDYEVLFEEFYRRRSEMVDLIAGAAADLESLSSAVKAAKEQVAIVEQDKSDAEKELAQRKRERDAVAAHCKAVEEKLAAIRDAVVKFIEHNQAAAAELARLQWEATRKIDERTKKMARLGVGQ